MKSLSDPSRTAGPQPGAASASAPGRGRAKRVFRALYLLTCNSILLLLALEIGVRLAASLRTPQPDDPPRSADDVVYTLNPFFQTAMPPLEGTSPGPFLAGWQVHPAEHAHTPGRKRILFLGGSTTVSDYPFEVKQRLDELYPVTIYIVAWDFHSSLHSLFKFWSFVDLIQPDLVIVLDAVNDFFRGFTPPGTSLPQYRDDYSHYSGGLFPFWTPGRARLDGRPLFHARTSARFPRYEVHDDTLGGLWDLLASESALARALQRVGSGDKPLEGQVGGEFDTLRSLPAFRRNMRNLALSAKAKGVRLLFLTMPHTVDSGFSFLYPSGFFSNDGVHHLPPSEFTRGMEAFNAAVLELREEPSVHALDVASKLTDKSLFKDEVHLTHKGLRLEAVLVAGYIREQRLLD